MARKADLSDFVLEKVLRLSKTDSLNAEHTLKLTIDMEGTERRLPRHMVCGKIIRTLLAVASTP